MIAGLVWTTIQPGDASSLDTNAGLLRASVVNGGLDLPIGARIVLVRSTYPPDPLWPGGGPWDTVRASELAGCGGSLQDSPAAWAPSAPTPVDWLVGSLTRIAVGICDPSGSTGLLDAPGGVPSRRRLHLGWIPPRKE